MRGGLLGIVSALVFAGLSSAAGPTFEPVGTSAWSPSTLAITTSEIVTFRNASTVNYHGITWTGGPTTPACTGVLGGSGGTNWAGTCSFPQAGSYPFVCSVHPAMTGTVTVSDAPEAPTVNSGWGTPTGDTQASLAGTVNPKGQATEYFFEYGTDTNYGQTTAETPAGSGTGPEAASADLTGLTAATTYHFKLVAENASGTREGLDGTFTTFGPPVPTTKAATAIGSSGGALQGTVNPSGHEATYYFKYGTDTDYGQTTPERPLGSGTAALPVSAGLTGLTPLTTYHYVLVAKSDAGTIEGIDRSFTTLVPPVPTTNVATAIGPDTATLQGSVNPSGNNTTYFFEWGTGTGYGQKTTPQLIGNGTAPVAVSARLTDLLPGTAYHFRVVAHTKAGTISGDDESFTIAGIPSPPPPPAGDSTPAPANPSQPPVATGPALGTAKVTPGKHGAPVKGSVEVLAPGAGGKLVVELKTKGKKGTLAGKSTKADVTAGNASFSVSLSPKAKATLKSRGKLTLTVTIVLTPPRGAPSTVIKSLTVTA